MAEEKKLSGSEKSAPPEERDKPAQLSKETLSTDPLCPQVGQGKEAASFLGAVLLHLSRLPARSALNGRRRRPAPYKTMGAFKIKKKGESHA